MFDYYRNHPEQADTFNQCMAEGTRHRLPTILDHLDLDARAHVVDIGGGTGTLVAEILRRHPGITATLFDLPEVVGAAAHVLAATAAGIRHRCTLVGGDFFHDPVPAGGDLYLLERIIHDWNDSDARRILANVRSRIVPGTRLVLIEHLASPEDVGHSLYDIAMMVVLGGRERTIGQYEALLNQSGFELHAVTTTVGCALIETRAT
ncbi:methyltransferase [Nocardia sp. IBHARD005]|uniref:methyltransferase n=1 Tax=Nocardia sp. IBHARD005 TaxID=3457765 RepID=UPI004058B65E